MSCVSTPQLNALKPEIRRLGAELGFDKIGFSDIQLQQDSKRFQQWLQQNFHADMHYLERHGDKRYQPELLVPGTLSVICARLNYLPANLKTLEVLRSPAKAYISRYALGRDYHKILRKKLQKLADKMTPLVKEMGYRVFTDSAPVLEKPLARKAGLGWVGKHTLILDKTAGSWFFLGEIYTSVPFEADTPIEPACGNCKACLTVCPTQAIIAPYQLDARRCISYLTIENKGPIAREFRKAIGNRIFGCDDCQLFCPWNRFAQRCTITDFAPREALYEPSIVELLNWSVEEFIQQTNGSPLKRTGYWGWLRNLSIAAGNAPACLQLLQVLSEKREQLLSGMLRYKEEKPPEWLLEHLDWAIAQQNAQKP